MSTQRQKKLAQEIVSDLKATKPRNKKELLVSSGYDETTAEKNQTFVIEQKGVQEELIALGFTENKAKRVVASIMNNENLDPNPRLKAADMTFKIHGTYAPEKSVSLNVEARIEDPKLKILNEEYSKKIFEALKDE